MNAATAIAIGLVVLLAGFAAWTWSLRRGVRRAVAAREAGEETLHRTVENLMDGLIVIDETGVVESANPAAVRIFGDREEEMVGRNVKMLMPDDLAAGHDGYLERYSSTGVGRIVGIGPREVTARHRDGTLFPLDLAISEMRTEHTCRFIGIVRDITGRKRAADDLRLAVDQSEQANRAKSEFLALMSHELRTPLNAVIGFSDIISREALSEIGNQRYRDYAVDINRSGQHLLDIINDILDLSKIEAGNRDLREEDVDVSEVIAGAWRTLEPSARSGDVALEFAPAGDLPGFYGDRRKLQQILLNLISNGIKFTKPGGRVTLETEADAETGYLFRISDTGIGIAADDLATALTPFGQVESDLARRYEGTGLGLPLTKSLVEMHDGTLELESRPRVGTVVTIRFPAARIAHSQPPREQATG